MKKYFFLSYCYGFHAKYLIEIALPSLFLEQNIPFLSSKFSVNFLFCVDKKTKKIIKHFFLNKQNISFRFLKFKKPQNRNTKIENMALHHCSLLKEVSKFDGICSFVYPESLFLNGTLFEINNLIKSGFKASVIPGFRGFELTTKTKKIFNNLNLLTRKKMINALISNLHPEMISQNLKEKYSFSNFCCIFIKTSNSIFLQDTVWDPLFIDTGSLSRIKWKTEKRISIDDGFIFRNFAVEDIYICKNNPNIGFYGFSEKTKTKYPAFPIIAKSICSKILREVFRLKNIYTRAFSSNHLFRNSEMRYSLLWETVVISDTKQSRVKIFLFGSLLKLYLLIAKIFGSFFERIALENLIRYRR